MHRYDVTACREKGVVKFFRVCNHQVNVERESRHFANCPDSVGSQTYVGSEVSICNVYVNHVCACFFHSPNLALQVCMVSRKNRGRDFDSAHSSNIVFTSLRTVSLSGALPWYAGSHSMKDTPFPLMVWAIITVGLFLIFSAFSKASITWRKSKPSTSKTCQLNAFHLSPTGSMGMICSVRPSC